MGTLASTLPLTVSVAAIMLFQVSALFVRELVRRNLLESGTLADVAEYQSAWAGFFVLVVLMMPYWRAHPGFVGAAFKLPGSWGRVVLTSVVIGMTTRAASWGFSIVSASLTQYGLPAAWLPPQSGLRWECPETGILLAGLVTMAVATPLLEEIINRGFILGKLLQENFRFSLLISAFLFAVLHRPDSIPAAFLFGAVAAIQYLHCHSLWGPVVAHATFNSISVIEKYCLSFLNLEATLLALPGGQLAFLGIAVTVVFGTFSVQVAKRTGAGTR